MKLVWKVASGREKSAGEREREKERGRAEEDRGRLHKRGTGRKQK